MLNKCECGCGGETKLADRTSTERKWTKGKPIRFIHGHNTQGKYNPDARYASKHQRVYAIRGRPEKCEFCGATKKTPGVYGLEWANMTGNYNDPADYKSLCIKCHRKHDRSPEENKRILAILWAGQKAYWERRHRAEQRQGS